MPSAYAGSKPVPLLVDFHPHGSTGPNWQRDSPYPKVIDPEGVIVAFPSALGDWNVGPCCADGVDDAGFAKALVSEVRGLACIDEKRVYAAAFSMGGGMTNFVACHVSDIVAAFAPAALDSLEEIVAECKPQRPITGSATDMGSGCQGYAPEQCQDGVEVVLCTKQGGGHEAGNATLTWPALKRHATP